MSENTAVATVADSEVATIEQSGRLAIRREKAVRQVYLELQGVQWGAALSPHTRAAVAAFCHDVGANPVIHVDLLGGKPYLNANYWSDKINGQDHYIGYEQINISSDKAAREDWGVPDWATHVYVTEIRRFINAAPMDKIRSGDVANLEPYIQTVRECNWAGGRPDSASKKDPIGNAEPAKTARSRSLRRCAARAFEAIRIQNKASIERAEELLLAEWRTEIERQQAELNRYNPRGLPLSQLKPGLSKNEKGDPISILADPEILKPVKVRDMPPPGMSEARYVAEKERAAQAEALAGAEDQEGVESLSEEEEFERVERQREIEEQDGFFGEG